MARIVNDKAVGAFCFHHAVTLGCGRVDSKKGSVIGEELPVNVEWVCTCGESIKVIWEVEN